MSIEDRITVTPRTDLLHEFPNVKLGDKMLIDRAHVEVERPHDGKVVPVPLLRIAIATEDNNGLFLALSLHEAKHVVERLIYEMTKVHQEMAQLGCLDVEELEAEAKDAAKH